MSLPLLSFASASEDFMDAGAPELRTRRVDGDPRNDLAREAVENTSEADHALAARIRAGDDQAFDELFRAHYEAACDYAARFVGDTAVAEDVAQDVFVRMLERRAQFHVETTIRGYVFLGVRRAALHHLRHGRVVARHVTSAHDVPFTMPAAETWIADAEVTRLVERAAAALPPRVQEAFLLRWRYELRYDEIAAAMGVSIKTVETHLTRALKAVREGLAGYVGRERRDPAK